MKKLIPLLLILFSLQYTRAQNTVTPVGSTNPGAASYIASGTLTDSLAKRYFMKFTGGSYNEIYTATFLNKYFVRNLDSSKFITPWQFYQLSNKTANKQWRYIISPDSLGAKGNGINDDYAAIQAALNTGKDINLTSNKRYKISAALAPSAGQRIIGNGATILISGTHAINLTDSVTVDGVRLVGSGKTTPNANEIGIYVKKHKGWTIKNSVFDSLAYTGVYVDSTVNIPGSLSPHYKSNTIAYCRFYNSKAGIVTGKAGEYVSIDVPIAQGCDTAIVNGGGNNPINTPMLVDNGINLYFKNGGVNDSHSSVTGGDINHATTYNVVIDSLQYGVQFTGVSMFASQIWIKNSAQVSFDNCWLSSRSAALPFISTNSNFIVANSTFIGTVQLTESGVHAQHNFNNNRLNYLPGLVTSGQRTTDSLLWCLNPATGLKVDKTIQGISFNGNTAINPINGLGYPYASGTTITYDNHTFLNTTNKYLTLDASNISTVLSVSFQDLNAVTGTRLFWAASPTNAPVGSNGFVYNYAQSSTVMAQWFIPVNGSPWFRYTASAPTGWSTWAKFATTTDVPAAANPTGTVGFANVNGSATTFMRSDAAPKIDTTSATGLSGKYVNRGKIAWPGTLYTTPTTGTFSTGGLTLSPALASQTANLVFASPNGSSGTPAFRALVSTDLPIVPTSKFDTTAFINQYGSTSRTLHGTTRLDNIFASFAQIAAVSINAVGNGLTLMGASGTAAIIHLQDPSGSPVSTTALDIFNAGSGSVAFNNKNTSTTVSLPTGANGTVALIDAVNTATDANYTITSGTQLVKLPVITANRTVTLPAASSYTGRLIRIWNQNSGTFLWTFASTVKDRDSTTITAMANQTWIVLESDGTNWNWIH